MIKRFFSMILCGASLLAAGNTVWQFNEGTDRHLNATGKSGVAGIICGSSFGWGSEDDRGIFLLFNGDNEGFVEFPAAPVFAPQGNWKIALRFSCDLASIKNRSVLLKKAGAYTLTVDGEGFLQISFPENGVDITGRELQIPSRVDCEVSMVRIGNELTVKLNKKSLTVSFKGDIPENTSPLFLAGTPGNFYKSHWFRMEFGKPETGGNKVNTSTVKNDPPGTVMFYDFVNMEPAGSVVAYKFKVDKWVLRKSPMLMNKTHILHPPAMGGNDITFDPQVKGKYDLYVGMRMTDTAGQIQVQVSGMNDYYTVETPARGTKHTNLHILLEKALDMTGKKVTLHSVGDRVYFDFIKLVPAEAKMEYPVPEGVLPTVTREKRKYPAERVAERLKSNPKYRERIYISGKTLPEPLEASKKAGFMLYPVNYMDMIFPESYPDTDTTAPVLEISAAKDEFEPGSFCVIPLQKSEKFSLKVTPLANGKNLIGTDNIKLGFVRHLPRRTIACYGASEYMNGPQYIEGNIPETLPENKVSQFFLTVHVPTDAAPGEYTGAVEIVSGKNVRQLPVKLTVYPFALDRTHGYDIGMSTAMQNIGFANDAEELKDLRDHNINTLFIQTGIGGDYVEISGDTPENIKIDYENSRLFKIMKEMKRLGYEGHVRMECSFALRFAQKFLPDKKAYDRAIVNIMSAINNHAKANGYPAMCFQLYDEIVSHPHMLDAYYQGIKKLKAAGITILGNHMWKKTTRSYPEKVARCIPYIDIFSMRYNSRNLWYVDSWYEIEDVCEAEGKILHAYNSNNAITFTQTETMRYMVGWFFRTAGKKTRGHGTWCYQWPNGNPYEDFDSSGSDWIYHYPPNPQENIAGGPAVNWECMREGVDDLRYILTLENLIRQAEKASNKTAAVSGKKLLKKLSRTFDVEEMSRRCIFLEQKWEKSGTLPDGKLYASGSFDIPNGVKPADYDVFRKKIAQEIINIKNQLEKKGN